MGEANKTRVRMFGSASAVSRIKTFKAERKSPIPDTKIRCSTITTGMKRYANPGGVPAANCNGIISRKETSNGTMPSIAPTTGKISDLKAMFFMIPALPDTELVADMMPSLIANHGP